MTKLIRQLSVAELEMAVKPIRTADDYEAALARLEEIADAKPGTAKGDEADVLSTLVEIYEKQNHAIEPPTALEAIKFRMDQLQLKPRDLVPDIGSRSRVSEVLAGQRPLTVEMISSLHARWDIPLASLIKMDNFERIAKPEPSKPVLKRLQSLKVMKPNEGYHAFRSRICGDYAAAYRKRTTSTTDPIALEAWCVATYARSLSLCSFEPKDTAKLGVEFLREIAQCSSRPNGLRAARDMLMDVGICFVPLRHFPSTHLDGAALMREDGVPIVAITARHDRIDNFWFTLLHECAHIILKHVGSSAPIFDDLEIASTDNIEQDADKHALDALIPPKLWDQFGANEYTSTAEILELANEAGVHAAVVAGRWRKQLGNYRKFSALLGHGSVTRAFEAELL